MRENPSLYRFEKRHPEHARGIGNQDKEAVQEAYKKVRNNVDEELTVSNIFF